ncbi:MAG: hypothetical protein AAFW75_13810 [Cyanobacteria bacterium J06636_16]
MSVLKRILASGLFGIAALFAGLAFDFVFDEIEDYTVGDAVMASALAVGSTAGGIWLWRSANAPKRKAQAEEAQRIQSAFYKLVQEKQGKFTLLEFAIAAQLSAAAARAFLDEQSKSFGADYNVTESGDIFYHFLLR